MKKLIPLVLFLLGILFCAPAAAIIGLRVYPSPYAVWLAPEGLVLVVGLTLVGLVLITFAIFRAFRCSPDE